MNQGDKNRKKTNFDAYGDALQVGYILGVIKRVDHVNQIPGVFIQPTSKPKKNLQ